MQRKRRAQVPEAFSRHLHEVWERASTGETIALDMGQDRKSAVYLRHRLYSLRKSYETYGTSIWRALIGFHIVIKQNLSGHYVLLIEHSDKSYEAMLEKAGFTPTNAPKSVQELLAEIEVEKIQTPSEKAILDDAEEIDPYIAILRGKK